MLEKKAPTVVVGAMRLPLVAPLVNLRHDDHHEVLRDLRASLSPASTFTFIYGRRLIGALSCEGRGRVTIADLVQIRLVRRSPPQPPWPPLPGCPG